MYLFSSFQLNLIESYIHFAYEPKPFPIHWLLDIWHIT